VEGRSSRQSKSKDVLPFIQKPKRKTKINEYEEENEESILSDASKEQVEQSTTPKTVESVRGKGRTRGKKSQVQVKGGLVLCFL
jgi:hypothetical protein